MNEYNFVRFLREEFVKFEPSEMADISVSQMLLKFETWLKKCGLLNEEPIEKDSICTSDEGTNSSDKVTGNF